MLVLGFCQGTIPIYQCIHTSRKEEAVFLRLESLSFNFSRRPSATTYVTRPRDVEERPNQSFGKVQPRAPSLTRREFPPPDLESLDMTDENQTTSNRTRPHWTWSSQQPGDVYSIQIPVPAAQSPKARRFLALPTPMPTINSLDQFPDATHPPIIRFSISGHVAGPKEKSRFARQLRIALDRSTIAKYR
jgi:hypothetical protein